LDELLAQEELWWNQRSRVLWLTSGDKNTQFFHQKANQRRRNNMIESITNQDGRIVNERHHIEASFLSYFQDIFTSQQTYNIADTTRVVQNKVSPEMQEELAAPFSDSEVITAITSMKGLAAPGPDGLPALFYQTHWNIVGPDIIKEVLNVLNNNGDPTLFNQTHICLIPKNKHPVHPSDYRPISLCNVILKLITKVIANRIKTYFS
jgi:hypothetical protein